MAFLLSWPFAGKSSAQNLRRYPAVPPTRAVFKARAAHALRLARGGIHSPLTALVAGILPAPGAVFEVFQKIALAAQVAVLSFAAHVRILRPRRRGQALGSNDSRKSL
jgi:hypothetical protein